MPTIMDFFKKKKGMKDVPEEMVKQNPMSVRGRMQQLKKVKKSRQQMLDEIQ